MDRQRLGDTVRRRREQRGLTVAHLAAWCELDEAMVARLEAGEGDPPPLLHLALLAEALGFPSALALLTASPESETSDANNEDSTPLETANAAQEFLKSAAPANDEAGRPALVVIRPARPDDAPTIARLHVDGWRAAYRGLLPDAMLDALLYEEREREWAAALSGPDALDVARLAEVGHHALGFCTGGRAEHLPEEVTGYDGEVYHLYVTPVAQGRGLGQRLLVETRAALERAGYRGIMLWALANNADARRFYERQGGTLLGARRRLLRGTEVDEVAYGWPEPPGDIA